MGIKKLIVVQNKIDLVTAEQAQKNYEEIKAFLKGTSYEDALIIPMSAVHKINLDVLLQTIEEYFTTPKRDLSANAQMYVARSFDINKPGTRPNELVGGILGGALKQGKLIEGQEIIIMPGFEQGDKRQKVWKPLKAKIVSVMTGNKQVKEATPGGSIALKTTLDPGVVKSDKLVGSVVGVEGDMPPVWHELKLETHLLERMVGAKDKLVVDPLKKGELLMLNVNAAATVGIVKEFGKNEITCTLKRPVCASPGARVTMSRNIGQRWRLIGYSIIKG